MPTATAGGLFSATQQINPDYDLAVAAAIRHEEVHLGGNHSERDAYGLQRKILQKFANRFRDKTLYQNLDRKLTEEIRNATH